MTDADEPRAAARPSKRSSPKQTAAKKRAARKATTAPSEAPPPTRPGPVRDGDDVVRAAAQIIEVFDTQADLFLAACANPVRALRDAGVELTPEAERYVAVRCRFSPAVAERLERLVGQVAEHLGDVDLDDDRAVAAALQRVGIAVELEPEREPVPTVTSSTAGTEQGPFTRRPRDEVHPNRRSVLAAAATLAQVQRWRQTRRGGADPFERHAEKHPVFGPLLEYRSLSASQPRFASDDVYERLARTRGGQLSESINITLHVRLNGTDDEDGG